MNSEQIELRCPNCKRVLIVERLPTDHPKATRVEIACCAPRGFDDVHFFDANENELSGDSESWLILKNA
jgi:hypothetical protein